MPLSVLVVHNAYRHRGGEDTVAEAEIALLRENGHAVETYLRTNEDIGQVSSLALARDTLWSHRTTREVTDLIARFRPDVIHSHNTFPLVSPSLYWAAAHAGVPVVQTLHNYRLICLNALFLREGRVCEDCMGRVPWRGVARACYRGSRSASVVSASMLMLHRCMGTYVRKVSRYIALSELSRRKFIEAGLPEVRVMVKPNFGRGSVEGATGALREQRRGLLFVGRLSAEKGVDVLVEAARALNEPQLRVIGEGEGASLLSSVSGVALMGNQPNHVVREEMARALALVVPSIWYEMFPMVAVESFASGTPLVASRIGALSELVREGVTGLLFEPGNARDLAAKLSWVLSHPDEMAEMGLNAMRHFESYLSPKVNYERLLEIYREAIAQAHLDGGANVQ